MKVLDQHKHWLIKVTEWENHVRIGITDILPLSSNVVDVIIETMIGL